MIAPVVEAKRCPDHNNRSKKNGGQVIAPLGWTTDRECPHHELPPHPEEESSGRFMGSMREVLLGKNLTRSRIRRGAYRSESQKHSPISRIAAGEDTRAPSKLLRGSTRSTRLHATDCSCASHGVINSARNKRNADGKPRLNRLAADPPNHP